MRAKIYMRTLCVLMGGVLTFLIFVGCSTARYSLKGVETKNITLTDVDFDEAFSKAIRAANEIGFGIHTTDKNAGTFSASKGLGYFEMSELNFFLERGSQGQLTAILRIKSSKSERIINEFINAYTKYVKINLDP